MAEEKKKKQTKKKEKKVRAPKKEEKKDYKPLPRDENFVEEQAGNLVRKDSEEKKVEDSEIKENEKKVETKKPEDVKPGKEDKKKEKKVEPKSVLEREYVIPLRKKVHKVQEFRRAKKAIRVIREFLVRHMRVENRDLNKVKIDKWLNEEIWFRGIKKPPVKIKVKAIKTDDGFVRVELAEIPEIVKWRIKKEEKKVVGKQTKKKEKVEEKPVETSEEKKEKEEGEKSSVESGLKAQKIQAKEMKHTATGKHAKITSPVRKSLKK